MGDTDDGLRTQPLEHSDGTAVEILEYVTRSELRVAILLAIDAEGPIDEHTLRNRFDAARTTVTRTLDGFADRGWIDRNGGTCRPTAYGRGIADRVRTTVADLDDIAQLSAFLRRVPADAFDLDPTTLAEASVILADPGSPYAPVERVTELRRDATTIRELSSIVARDSAEQVHDRAVSGDATFEIVLQDDVVEQIHASEAYRRQFERTVSQAGVEVRVYDGVFPFLVVLLDEDTVALGVTNEENLPAALVVSDDDRVRSWAETVYREYYEAARPYDAG